MKQTKQHTALRKTTTYSIQCNSQEFSVGSKITIKQSFQSVQLLKIQTIPLYVTRNPWKVSVLPIIGLRTQIILETMRGTITTGWQLKPETLVRTDNFSLSGSAYDTSHMFQHFKDRKTDEVKEGGKSYFFFFSHLCIAVNFQAQWLVQSSPETQDNPVPVRNAWRGIFLVALVYNVQPLMTWRSGHSCLHLTLHTIQNLCIRDRQQKRKNEDGAEENSFCQPRTEELCLLSKQTNCILSL